MTISSSLNASVAGLAANVTRLATISDNIANSATPGYKRAVADFNSMVLKSGKGSYSAGGVRASTTRLVDQGGALTNSANPTDMAVQGRGMLPVTTAAAVGAGNAGGGLLLTTTGSFRPDAQGYLRSPGGLILMGIPANADGNFPAFARDTADALAPIQINANQFVGEPTTRVNIAVNVPATATRAGMTPQPESIAVEYFDNLGSSSKLQFSFTPTIPATGASNEWTMQIRDSETDADADNIPDLVAEYTLTFDDTRGGGGTLASVVNTPAALGGPYDPVTGSLTVDVNGGPVEIEIGRPGAPGGLTQLSDTFAPVSVTKNGAPVGSLAGVEIDQNGILRATFDSGLVRDLYRVPLVDVRNVNGLEAAGQQTFRVTPESGNFFMWDAGDGPTGAIIGYAQEQSATDVAGELTQLIQTQRAYSSNAKVIQTVDEMLQETTNIKR